MIMQIMAMTIIITLMITDKNGYETQMKNKVMIIVIRI